MQCAHSVGSVHTYSLYPRSPWISVLGPLSRGSFIKASRGCSRQVGGAFSTATIERQAMPGKIVHTVFWKWNDSQPADLISQLRTAAQGMVGACFFLPHFLVAWWVES